MHVPKVFRGLLRHSLFFILYCFAGVLCGAVSFVYFYADGLPDLNHWHTTILSNEFTYRPGKTPTTLDSYLAQEEDLFDELRQTIAIKHNSISLTHFSRYKPGGQLDPTHYSPNWNRSLYLRTDNPQGGFLLLHGLSDSPYSLHSLAETLHRKGGEVLALRLPGHGTMPSGLLNVSAEDFKQAVRLGARALRENIGPDKPLFIVGYSNGATLALEYALAQLEGEAVPEISGLVMISPAISVSEFAAFAAWQRRLSVLPGLEKLAWHSIQPEYDPYKYNSFTLNAAAQIYYLTRDIQVRLNRLHHENRLGDFPPVQVFLSAVDATVSANAVINDFLLKLPGKHHHLTVYDINREEYSAFLFAQSTQQVTAQLLQQPLPFALTLLTNSDAESSALISLEKAAGSTQVIEKPLDLVWPAGIFSLSHVALPFSPHDPVYGDGTMANQRHQSLGNIRLRGERGVLRIPDGQLIRLRFNPFYHWQEASILDFLQLQPEQD